MVNHLDSQNARKSPKRIECPERSRRTAHGKPPANTARSNTSPRGAFAYSESNVPIVVEGLCI